ncbi:MAG TPA: hypothetical protein VK453_13205 [Micromonosporaceae bacterium]|nr:hypothetical protein [Micromonosporaceae bacterium]
MVAGSYPAWLLPALIMCWSATGGLALINTAALRHLTTDPAIAFDHVHGRRVEDNHGGDPG